MTKKSLTFGECKQLSSRIIAMNPNRRANMGQISSHLLDYYTELTKQPWLAQLVGQIRDLTAQQNQMMQEEMKAGETYQQLDRKITDLKKQQPFRSPHYFHFLEDHRAQKFIDPEAFTFQTTVDFDNPEEVEPAVKNALLLNGMFDEPTEKLFREKIFSAEDIELWKGKVLHIERSARNKAHIDIVLIFDKSNSMGENNNRLLSACKPAATTLINTIAENTGIDARYSVVTFSGSNSVDAFGKETDAQILYSGNASWYNGSTAIT